MQARGRESAGQFWWRAAEPIPARPEELAVIDDHDAVPVTAAPQEHRPQSSVHAAARPAPSRAREHERPAAAYDLGAYRPATPRSSEDVSPAPEGGSHRATGFERISGVEGVYGPVPPGARRLLVRRRRTLIAAGLAGALLFAAITGFGRHVRLLSSAPYDIDDLLVSAGFGINEVSLTGHHQTPDQDVFRALGVGRATLLTLDVDAARRRVEALPWIESATLVRIFPDKLRVDLRERRPAAAWHDGDRIALVDAEGRVLSHVAASAVPGLPRIAGPGAPAAAAELHEALLRYPRIGARVRLARRISERRWDLELKNGARVKLAAGATAPSLERLVRLEHETRWLDHAGQVVDLTVPTSIAVFTPVPLRDAQRASAREAPARPL